MAQQVLAHHVLLHRGSPVVKMSGEEIHFWEVPQCRESARMKVKVETKSYQLSKKNKTL